MPNEQPGTIAPHSAEAESSVLGSMLIDQDCIDDVASILTTVDFFIVRNGYIYQAILAIHERKDEVDFLTVVAELKARKVLDTIGGSGYISSLINDTPTSLHVLSYARLIERAAVRRRLLAAASEIAQQALEENEATDKIVSRAIQTIEKVEHRKYSQGITSIRDAASDYYDHVERMHSTPGELMGYKTHYNELDQMLSGMQPDTTIIVGARPSIGKTAFLINATLRLALQFVPGDETVGVGFFSLEMSTSRILNRMNAVLGSLNAEMLHRGRLNNKEWNTFVEVTGRLSGAPIFIDSSKPLGMAQIRSKVRQMARHGVKVVCLDYLQLMETPGGDRNRNLALGEISRGLKLLAGEQQITIMAAAQLNREIERRENKRPMLSDLRESGNIEADADVVMLMDKPGNRPGKEARPNEVDFYVEKNRNGAAGLFTLYWVAASTRFDNHTRKEFNVSEIEV